MFKSNPAFSNKVLSENYSVITKPMSVNGVVAKSFLQLAIAVIGAFAACSQIALGYVDKIQILMTPSIILALILAFIIIFKPNTAKYLSPVYSFLQGVVLGTITMYFEAAFPGIALQAISLTFLSLFTMLTLYRLKIIQATPTFVNTVIIATASIMVLYIIDLIMMFFGHSIPMIHQSGTIGIAFSLIVVVIASLNFIIDFSNIETGAANLLPKEFEWYFSFALMVTLFWLYLEILRLLSKIAGRRQ